MYGAPPCPSTTDSATCVIPDCPTPAPTPSPTPHPSPAPTPHPTPEPTPEPLPAPAAPIDTDVTGNADDVSNAGNQSGMWIGVGVGSALAVLALLLIVAACVVHSRGKSASNAPSNAAAIRIRNIANVSAIPPPLGDAHNDSEQAFGGVPLPRYSHGVPNQPRDDRVISAYQQFDGQADTRYGALEVNGPVYDAVEDQRLYQDVPHTGAIDKSAPHTINAARDRSMSGTLFRDASYAQVQQQRQQPQEYGDATDVRSSEIMYGNAPALSEVDDRGYQNGHM